MGTPQSHVYSRERGPIPTSTLKIELPRITAVWPKRIYIQWLLRNPSPGETYVFQLYRSGSAEGPWEQIGTDLTEQYSFLDTAFTSDYRMRGADLMSLTRTVYYKITVTGSSASTAETTKVLEAGLDRRRKGLRRKLVRDAGVFLEKITGSEIAVLKRKRWGAPCTYCQSSTGQSVRAHCGHCHGTGILGGYWNPVYGFAQISRKVNPVQVSTEASGKVETHRTEVLMLDIPQIEHDDVLVFLRGNKRFKVVDFIPTQLQTVPVHQELIVTELARSASEHKITVDDVHSPRWF